MRLPKHPRPIGAGILRSNTYNGAISNRSAHTGKPTGAISPRNDCHFIGLVGLFEQRVEVPHYRLERRRHEVEAAIGEDDGVLLVLAKVLLGNDTVQTASGWVA